MIFREATIADLPQIMAIEHSFEYRHFITQWPEDRHRGHLTDVDSRYFVAVDDLSDVQAYAILFGLKSDNRSIELRRLAVKTPGRGSGRKLVKFIVTVVFEELLAHKLWLDVAVENRRAQHLYQSFGFTRDGILRDAALVDGRFHSLWIMSILEDEYRALIL